MNKKEEAQRKFRLGETMKPEELVQLELVDRCRYVVSNFFPKGFSAGEVTQKLNELLPKSSVGGYTPMEVHDALVQFYGRPA